MFLELKDPTRPEHIGSYQQFGDLFAGHVHDAYVQNDTAYLNCGYDGFAIVDFTDPENIQTLATLLGRGQRI